MSQTLFNTGLGRGRARGRRDIAEGEQLAERRPGRFRVEDWEGELAGTQSEAESKWISMEDSAPSPYLGYSGAPSRGARVAQFQGEYRRAETPEFSGVDEDAASSGRMRARADRITCSEVASIGGEQNEHDEQNMTSFYPSRFEEGCRRQSEQDSESVASGQRRMSPVELGGHGILQLIEDVKAEFQALRAGIRETIADARAVFQRPRAGMQNPANKDMSSQQCMEAAPRAFPAKNAGVNAACEQSYTES